MAGKSFYNCQLQLPKAPFHVMSIHIPAIFPTDGPPLLVALHLGRRVPVHIYQLHTVVTKQLLLVRLSKEFMLLLVVVALPLHCIEKTFVFPL